MSAFKICLSGDGNYRNDFFLLHISPHYCTQCVMLWGRKDLKVAEFFTIWFAPCHSRHVREDRGTFPKKEKIQWGLHISIKSKKQTQNRDRRQSCDFI